MTSNSLYKQFGDFLRDLGCTPSRADQELWVLKYDEYEGYDYTETPVDDVIINAKNPSKYMHEIYMHFKVRYITDYPNYYLVNELLLLGYCINLFMKEVCE